MYQQETGSAIQFHSLITNDMYNSNVVWYISRSWGPVSRMKVVYKIPYLHHYLANSIQARGGRLYIDSSTRLPIFRLA